MRSRQIASVAVFCLGGLAFYYSVGIVQALITMPYYPGELRGRISLIVFAYLFPLLILLGVGLVMVLKRHQVAEWILSGAEEEAAEATDLPAVLVALLGLYLVVSTLPDLGALAGQLIAARALPDAEMPPGLFWSTTGRYLGTIVQLILGAYLFFHTQGLARWWGSRARANPKPADAAPNLPVCEQCGTPFDPADYQDDAGEKRCSRCKSPLPSPAFPSSDSHNADAGNV